MNLPLGISAKLELGLKKKDGATEETAAGQEQVFVEYREALENYKKCILNYSNKLDGFERQTMENQLSNVQAAIDLTYMKEQGDKTIEVLSGMKEGPISKMLLQMEGLTATILEANDKLECLDQNVVNRLSDLLQELQKQSAFQNKELQTELFTSMERLTKSVKKGHALLWFLFIFNLISLSGVAFLILYILEIISF